MKLEQIMAYLDGRLSQAERGAVEDYLATAEGQQARQALGLLQRGVREATATDAPCEHLEVTCALAEGALEGEEKEAAEAHLVSCPACFQSYCDLQQPLPAPAAVPPAALDRVLEPPPGATIIPMPSRPARVAARRWWQGGAAGLAVAAVLVAVVWHPGRQQTSFDLPAGPGAVGSSGHATTTSVSRPGEAAPMPAILAGKQAPEQRINALLQDLQQSPDNVAARLELAQLYDRLGKKALAIKHYHLLQTTLLGQGHVGSQAYAQTEQRLQALER